MKFVSVVLSVGLFASGCATRPGGKVVEATVLSGIACGGAGAGLTFLAKAPPADQSAQLGYDENRDVAKNRAKSVGIISASVCAGTALVLGAAMASKSAADRARTQQVAADIAKQNEALRRSQFESQQAAAIIANERAFNQRVVIQPPIPSPATTAYSYDSMIREEERRLREREQMLYLRRRANHLKQEEERLEAEENVRYSD